MILRRCHLRQRSILCNMLEFINLEYSLYPILLNKQKNKIINTYKSLLVLDNRTHEPKPWVLIDS